MIFFYKKLLTGNDSRGNIMLSVGNVTDNDADTDTENGTEVNKRY